MIKLKDLSKSFSGKWALRGLTLEIPKGEIFGIVGPNGAGKTTAIRMMSGLLMPTEGEVLIGGYNIVTEPIKAKSILGYVPDRPFFYEKLTAREFLAFIALVRGLSENRALAKMQELIELFAIKDMENDLIEGYSQGMRQRLIFAGALIHSPEVLLIDEPFIGIDPIGVILLKGLIKDLSDKGITVFLATHSLHIAGELCHRIGLINKGILRTVKNRKEILSMEGGLEGFFLKGVNEGAEPPAKGVNDPGVCDPS